MKLKIYHILAAALLLPFAGCSDTEEWTPGPEDNESGTRAYIVKPSKTSYICDIEAIDSETTIDVNIARTISDEAISIPLVLKSDSEGISLTGNAEFAAGQTETTVTVDFEGIPIGEWKTFTVEIPDDQFYTYGIGLPSVQFSVIKSKWIERSSKVTYYYWDDANRDIYPKTYGQLFQLDGTYQFKMTDFLGSGLDMEFICDTGKTTKFLPLYNADYASANDTDYHSWYFYDEANETWPSWVPGDVSGVAGIQYLWVYGYDDDYEYSYITMVDNSSTLYGYVYLNSYIDYTDGTGGYANLYATFNLNENPFTK